MSWHNAAMPLDYPNPNLELDGIRLRRWRESDVACVEEASADERIPTGTTVPALYTRDEGLAFIARQHNRQTSGQGLSMAIADAATDEARGLCFLGLGRTEGHCRIGYWVVPAARRQGMATAAVTAASRWLLRATDIYRITAVVEPANETSIGVLERCGFHHEGTMRRYLRIGDEQRTALLMSLLDTDIDSPAGNST